MTALLAGFGESTASSRRLTSRKGCGLSGPNLNLDRADLRRPCRLRRFEVQFNRFLEVGKSLVLRLALADDVEFDSLGNIPLSFAPDGRSERSLHYNILSQDSPVSHAP